MSLIVTLLAIGLILVLAELFLPGGICGCLGGLLLLGGTALVFMDCGLVVGCWFTLGLGVLTVLLCLAALKLVPRMPVVKSVLHTADARDWLAYDPALQDLLGRTGSARTTLRPAGIAVVDGRRLDVVTGGEMIEKDTPVKIIAVEGNRIVVEAASN